MLINKQNFTYNQKRFLKYAEMNGFKREDFHGLLIVDNEVTGIFEAKHCRGYESEHFSISIKNLAKEPSIYKLYIINKIKKDIIKVLGSMCVPIRNDKDLTFANVKWLIENLRVLNSNNPKYRFVLKDLSILSDLLI